MVPEWGLAERDCGRRAGRGSQRGALSKKTGRSQPVLELLVLPLLWEDEVHSQDLELVVQLVDDAVVLLVDVGLTEASEIPRVTHVANLRRVFAKPLDTLQREFLDRPG